VVPRGAIINCGCGCVLRGSSSRDDNHLVRGMEIPSDEPPSDAMLRWMIAFRECFTEAGHTLARRCVGNNRNMCLERITSDDA
jgi:hypothetical protein